MSSRPGASRSGLSRGVSGGDTGGRSGARRRPARRPAKRGGSDSGSNSMLVRIGAILAVFAVVGIINLARSKPAGDVRYFNALADLTEQIHNNPFSNLDSIRRGINNLPIGGVTDPMLKEMHRMWLELLELADHADGSPEFEARARSLGQRIDNQIDKLNAKYGR